MLATLLIVVSAHAPAPQESNDPVTGVWKGLATDDGPLLPESGLPTSLLLRLENGRVNGNLFVQGFDLHPVDAVFDAETGIVEFGSKYQGFPLVVKLEIEGERLTGAISGMAMRVDLAAERISRELLEEPPAPDRPVDVLALTDEAWEADLEFLGAYLPQVHANAFHRVDSARWRAAIEELRASLPEQDGLQTCVALARLVALVGDAHTEFGWREVPGFGSVPLRLQIFADGLFVTAVDEAWADALGCRVVRFGEHSAEDSGREVASLFAAENESWRRAQIPGLLIIPKLMRILGFSSSDEQLELTIELASGEHETLVVETSGTGTILTAPDPAFDQVARWQQRRRERYWFDVLDHDAAVYFAYNSCAEDPARPMSGFIDEVLDAVETIEAERLIVDLRNNTGGNSAVLSEHIERLAQSPRLKDEGRIAVLIGPVTYSSGMMNAHQLRERTSARLYGEPTGGKPNSYGELRSFRLPNSGIAVYYSTKYFRLLPDSDPPAVEPDVPVELSSEDFFSGYDPVLERVLER